MGPYAQTNIQLYQQLQDAGFDEDAVSRVVGAYALAVRLFTGQYRGSGKTLLAHVVGTASILLRHGADVPVICAGLLHAAYVCGDFGSMWTGVTSEKRRQVKAAVGADVEALVFRYEALRCHLWDLPAVPERLAKLEESDKPVLLMHIANDLEETLEFGVVYCGVKKRDSMIATLEVMGVIADLIDKPELANELRKSRSAISGKHFPVSWQTGEKLTYTVCPASSRKRSDIALREQIKAVLMVVWNRLPRSLRYYLRR